MLPKKNRLTRAVFNDFRSLGQEKHSSHFGLRVGPGNEVRVGVSVSKKVAKSAVARNTLRRRVYEVVRNRISKLPKGMYLIRAKAGSPVIKGNKLVAEIEPLLNNTVGR